MPRAIVLEGTGRGNANDQVVEGVREAVAAGVAVVVCSRCAEGRVEPVYGRGGGRDLAEAGALFAGDLAGPKARVLLQVALGAGLDPAAILAAEAGLTAGPSWRCAPGGLGPPGAPRARLLLPGRPLREVVRDLVEGRPAHARRAR